MTKYEAGRRAEYKLKALLEQGGLTVLRTAGSHGQADLIAVDPKSRGLRLIQVKVTSSKKPSYARELDELAKLTPKGPWRVSSELWVWRKGGSSWQVETV